MSQGNYGQPMHGPPPSSGLATASLITGILALLSGLGSCIPFVSCITIFSTPTFALIAIITGFVAQSQIKQGTATGKEMALAGIIMGFAGIGLLVLLFVLAIALGIGNAALQGSMRN